MASNVITSQPVSNCHVSNEVFDPPPSYEEVISQQPKSSNFNNPANDDEITAIPETEHIAAAQLNSEQENKCENCEEQRRNSRNSDCCFVCYVDNDPGWWICCRLFSDCCICLGDCTESCCEGCADCLHSCCESNTADNTNDDCCDDNCFLCAFDCDCSD